jgi:hypothetical protein
MSLIFPEDGNIRFLSKVGTLLTGYTATYPRTQPSSDCVHECPGPCVFFVSSSVQFGLIFGEILGRVVA